MTPAQFWHQGVYAGFDLETTGKERRTAGVVTAATGLKVPGERVKLTELLADPGMEIEAGAAKIHGITNEYAREHGRPVRDVLEQVTEELTHWCREGIGIAGANLVYDFTVLHNNCLKHGVRTLSDRLAQWTGGEIRPLIDVIVIDRRTRSVPAYMGWGGHKLSDVARHYKVVNQQAHNSASDVLTSMIIAWRMMESIPKLKATPLHELHQLQRGWHAKWMADMVEDKRRQGKAVDDPDPSWPLSARDDAPAATPELWSDATPEERQAVAALAAQLPEAGRP